MYNAQFQFWISETQGHFLGKGRVELLERIGDLGSISKAAKSMKMSYRQAWQMVEDMNARSTVPIIEKVLGGAGGGGAKITEHGLKMIELYHNARKKIAAYIDAEIQPLLN